jgi:hypothetical protein
MLDNSLAALSGHIAITETDASAKAISARMAKIPWAVILMPKPEMLRIFFGFFIAHNSPYKIDFCAACCFAVLIRASLIASANTAIG